MLLYDYVKYRIKKEFQKVTNKNIGGQTCQHFKGNNQTKSEKNFHILESFQTSEIQWTNRFYVLFQSNEMGGKDLGQTPLKGCWTFLSLYMPLKLNIIYNNGWHVNDAFLKKRFQ